MTRDNDRPAPLQVHWLGVVEYIPPELWGRDHHSTLLYAETRAVDHAGKLSESDPRMRVDRRYPTRLAADVEIIGHTDYDCLADAQAAGFLTYSDGLVRFTDTGWEYVHRLRRERASAHA